jgi:Domain of unknown function (DUF4249)
MKKYITIIILIFLITACEEPFDVSNKYNLSLFSVSAMIVDSMGGPPIRLSQSELNTTADITTLSPVSDAIVEIIENGKSKFQFLEDKNINGFYNPPPNFFAKPNFKYVLNIKLQNGVTYISEAESMPETNLRITDLNKKVKLDFIRDYYYYGFLASHDLLMDIQDDPKVENYYQVRYNQIEEEEYCDLSTTVPPLLTGCRYMCWTKAENKKLSIFSDKFGNGQTIKNINIGNIIYNQPFPALIQISLLGITKNSYDYWKITQDQVEKQGSLADTPPVAYIGNMSLTTQNGFKPIGYFMVAKQKKINYLLKRDEPDLENIEPEFVKRRRNIDISIIPCIFGKNAPCFCKETETTTSKLPEGWPIETRRVLQPEEI